MEYPIVSIILPTYNGALFIKKAIESVLGQTFKSWELLVINDASTDETETVIKKYSSIDNRIILINNENNLGIQKTLNKGISLAKGEYIARIDDDDQWIDPMKLIAQVSFFEKNRGYVLLGTDAIVLDSNGKKISINIMPKNDRIIRTKILSKNPFLHATIMARKKNLEEAGGYNETKNFLHIEDYELWLRLGKMGKFANLPETAVALTVHDKSLTSKNRALQARNMIRAVVLYRNDYPNYYKGMSITILRYLGFESINSIPIPKKMFYTIQSFYKRI
jgi:glycosyltransferase involved in cell wall biosynthesis